MRRKNGKPVWLTYTCSKPVLCTDCQHLINKGESYLRHLSTDFSTIKLHHACYNLRCETIEELQRAEYYVEHGVYEVCGVDLEGDVK
jgi:hypothetical protein